jgi:hypothetical protein
MNTEKATIQGETPAPAPERDAAVPAPAPARDEHDPSGAVPVICKDCGKGFTLPYRLFQVGVVFHCPHCRGSFVPTLPMYRAVRDAFERFEAQRERDKCVQAGADAADISRKQAAEREAFRKTLEELARAMRPAGKMVKPKGLRAMFT